MIQFQRNLIFRISTLQTKNAQNCIVIGQFLNSKLVRNKHQKLSDHNKILSVFGLKCADSKYQVSSKSDHFWAIFLSGSASWGRLCPEILTYLSFCKNIYMLGIFKKSEVAQGKLILLVVLDFKMAAIAKPAIRGQKYFGWVTFCMIGLIDISFKKIDDFEFG